MRILIVAATAMEITPLVAHFRQSSACDPWTAHYVHAGHEVEVLLTGVGMVATAARCARALAQTRFDFALNIGVCGSFDRALEPGMVVHIVSDRIVELGAEDGDRFLTIEELDLLEDDDRVEVTNPAPPSNAVLNSLPAVRGITVNTVHGNDRSIADVVGRFNPQVESMEGAAFMYTCLMQQVPFAQVRAVSNIVEKRNRGGWRMADAVSSLSATAFRIVDTL